MPRTLCNTCQYPSSVCVCHGIKTVNNTTQIVILQHPSERKAAKNTARLVQLCCANVVVAVGENPIDFKEVAEQVRLQSVVTSEPRGTSEDSLLRQQRVWSVIYPHANSRFIEDYRNRDEESDQRAQGIILLDGTWRKAYKMWQLNTWLHTLPSWCFKSPPDSRYIIRSGAPGGGLSTLEAVAYSLQHLELCDTKPLLQSMDTMMENYLRFSLR